MSDLVRLKYGYDRVSNSLYRRDEVARSNGAKFDELYQYDGLHRLDDFDRGQLNGSNTALVGNPTLGQEWTLDQTGNWSGFTQTVHDALTQTRTHNTVNEITNIAESVGLDWATPAYDANGNMSTVPQPDALDDSYTATWDAWNRLVKLTNDADGDKTVAEYEYDGLNRRTIKKSYDSGGTLDETRHDYYSDQWQVLEERVGSSTSADSQYVWGQRYVDDLVLRDTSSERLYALQDALFNVAALTDDTGSVKERFAYQPYGTSEPLDPDFTLYSGTDFQWEYCFTGRELDLESGLQINRNRYLQLQLGTWISRDPIEYWQGEWSLYGYVKGNPTNGVDPDGEQLIPIPIPPQPCGSASVQITMRAVRPVNYQGATCLFAPGRREVLRRANARLRNFNPSATVPCFNGEPCCIIRIINVNGTIRTRVSYTEKGCTVTFGLIITINGTASIGLCECECDGEPSTENHNFNITFPGPIDANQLEEIFGGE